MEVRWQNGKYLFVNREVRIPEKAKDVKRKCGEQLVHTKWKNVGRRVPDRYCNVNRHWRENETMCRRIVVWQKTQHEIDAKPTNFTATITWVCSELFNSFSLLIAEIISRIMLDNVQRKRSKCLTPERIEKNDEWTVTTADYRRTWRSKEMVERCCCRDGRKPLADAARARPIRDAQRPRNDFSRQKLTVNEVLAANTCLHALLSTTTAEAMRLSFLCMRFSRIW